MIFHILKIPESILLRHFPKRSMLKFERRFPISKKSWKRFDK